MIVAFACIMTLIMYKCSEFGIVPNLLEIVNHNSSQAKFLIFRLRDWQRMTMETIASCAFGIDANSIKDPDSPFLQKCRGFFEQVEKITPLSRIVGMCLCMFYANNN